MSDLGDYVGNLKRAVAPPGRFAEVFPSSTDPDLVGYLMDGAAEAQLDGFLNAYNIDVDLESITPDVTPSQVALVVLYSASTILTVELMNRKTHTRYEAPGLVFEQDQGSQLLSEMLKAVSARKAQLLKDAKEGRYAWNGGDGFGMADLAFVKNTEWYGPGQVWDYGDALGR